MKILTIGGATEDIFIQSQDSSLLTMENKNIKTNYMLFESGQKIEIEKILYLTGGGATNSAYSFKKLGFSVNCFCQVGNDTIGKQIINKLKKVKIKTNTIIKSNKHPSGQSYIINSLNGERTIFAYRGANGYLQKNDIPLNEIKNSNQLYITSLSNNSAKLLPEITTFAKKHKIPVAINPGISQLTKGMLTLKQSLKNIETLVLNYTEAKRFLIALVENDTTYKKLFTMMATKMSEEKTNVLNKPILYENTYFSIRKFFKHVLNMGPKIVVVTNGEHGVYVATKKQILFHPSLKVKVVDSVGAGDSFGSCFVAFLAMGEKIENALKYGIINSAAVIQQVGAKNGLLGIKQIKNEAKKISSKSLKKFLL